MILKYTMKKDAKKSVSKTKGDTKEEKVNKKEQIKIVFIADKEKKLNYTIEFELGEKTFFVYEPKLTNSGSFYETNKKIP